ncbi:YchJ family protein [Aquimarina longa]|uniref:YchJ family protein n=1 Tax=Aquimarina longa TaxID=1080221 RepID=UPI000784BAA1|nr:YchJ family metal-binding protein [Aquimarina longa]
MDTCYCGNPKLYADCCAKIHQDINKATTAEELMRSRYTAYVLAKGDYLMKSHHTTTRPTQDKKNIVRWTKSVQWIKLEVITTQKGAAKDTEGTVAFKAFYYDKQGLQMIHETSKFVKQYGHWVYLGEA